MNAYILTLTVLGTIIVMTAWLPMVLKRLPLSLPTVCVCLGIGLALSPLSFLASANPLENREITERITELVVIISLMGGGLKLDRALGLKSWSMTWRLLGVAMPLTILLVSALGWSLLGLSLASAVLLGAALAPTDPVLASDVQVGPPNSEDEDEVRFSLTSEAGLNDGLSFPFVYLAIALALAVDTGQPWFTDWLLSDVIWKLAAGGGIGWAMGRVMGELTFRFPDRAQLAKSKDGLVAIGITFLTYGITELAHGYGFLAVFVAAITFRGIERRHRYHDGLHSFTDQIERLLMMVILVCFGAAIAEGSIFAQLSWQVVAAAVLIIFIIRPASGLVSLVGQKHVWEEKAVIAFFGIRGLGSFYYLAFALGKAEFDGAETLWVTLCLTVLISIVLHGTTVTPVMDYLDRRRNRDSRRTS